MIGLYIAIMIIFGFIEARRLDTSSRMYRAPAFNKYTGKQTTEVQAWIGRMIGDGLLLLAIFIIVRFIVNLF